MARTFNLKNVFAELLLDTRQDEDADVNHDFNAPFRHTPHLEDEEQTPEGPAD